MKNILLIGVGGTGSRAVDIFFQKKNELGAQSGNHVTALVFDTDAGDVKNISAATPVVMADTASVGTICDRFGKEYLREWFPCDDPAIRSQEMIRGASQWRKKSYLAFLNLMNKPLARAKFIGALEQMVADPGSSCEIYVISSVAGGTGSGSFIPIALYAKRYLRKHLGKDPIVNAMIALPEIYADSQTPENRVKIYANAYAILRELNAINLVARNYNEGRTAHKKAPINFRIGHPDEPSVGVLFDAADKQFWTPEAAPFTQVFLLDRIPGLKSIIAHDIVLANSLYTILCTDIGSAFDSEFSNHELLRSQNNGSNAIYAGISTSQICFPKESVLDYVAHRRTLDACENEWMVLHNATENEIREREQREKEAKRRYVMQEGEYASIVLDKVETLEDNENDDVVALIDRGTAVYEKDGTKSVKTGAQIYFDFLTNAILEKVPSVTEFENQVAQLLPDDETKPQKTDVTDRASGAYELILKYYKQCIDEIKRSAAGVADSVITFDKKKESFSVNKKMSLTENLLKKGDSYIHPVAAMVQLCRIRKLITEALAAKTTEWEDLRKRSISMVPESIIEVAEDEEQIKATEGFDDVKTDKSYYFRQGKERFIEAKDGALDMARARTDAKADLRILKADVIGILYNISFEAQNQMKTRVLKRIAADVDLLIEKYRAFFNRFEKEKEELIESAKTALRKDSENVDSVINVYSSIESKKSIMAEITAMGGPVTDAEIASTDNVVGKGVFETAFAAAVAAVSKDTGWNDKDSGAYRSLFGNMVASYREFIRKNEAFERIASYNVVEAIVASCGGDMDKASEEFRKYFSVAQELAVPSLRVDTSGDSDELVRPSNIMVFMMSLETGRYIKRHADELALHMPADQNNEFTVIKSCAEEFISRYSGNNGARVAIVESMSSSVLYCTGEIMDITPLRISKFDELGSDNTYYTYYRQAIANCKKYTTDMWNPHIGFNLHKRGYLPYMNEAKEKQCDDQMVKALLYAFVKQKITYTDGMGEARGKFFFNYNGTKITDPDNKWINIKNVAQLISWIRNEDELVEEWSNLFDIEIRRQMNALPSLASENANEIASLERSLTESPFMQLLTDSLFVDSTEKSKRIRIESGKATGVDRKGPTVIEFAYMIKTSEEVGRDCDDAERILDVAYDTFMKLCAYRTTPENTPERFIQVYKQQLENVYEAIASAKIVAAAGAEAVSYFNQFTAWLNGAGVFKTICDDTPMDEKGNICIETPFDLSQKNAADVKKILNYIRNGKEEAETPADTTATV